MLTKKYLTTQIDAIARALDAGPDCEGNDEEIALYRAKLEDLQEAFSQLLTTLVNLPPTLPKDATVKVAMK